LFQILGKERALDQIALLDPSFINKIKDLPQADFQEKIGEYLMEQQGMTFDNKWNGTSSFLLTDNLVDGYILANKQSNGIIDKFTVSATLNRNSKSWDGFIQSVGIPATSKYNKGLDSIEYIKRDLNNTVIDKYPVTGVQTVDVYDKGSDQPYNSKWLDKTIQGNTVISDFTLKMLTPENGVWKPMAITNTWTLDGNWINSNGNDSRSDYRWLLHGGTTNQTSDGCFIPSNESLLELNKKMTSWGVHQAWQETINDQTYTYNQLIKGSTNDWRSFWIKKWGEK